VNNTVPLALKTLGYDQPKVESILAYIDEHDTIEGAGGLRDEHLAVFDCAFKAAQGSRAIHYLGHLRMMGAVQPFISGAISKTINMPNAASVDDIMEAYVEAWRLGVKAVAIYRDGCKRTQPLNTSKQAKAAEVATTGPDRHLVRRRLPQDCPSIRHKFDIAGHEGYIHVGSYEDGSPGEIFIKIAKEGSTISGLMDTIGILTSMALQYGVPLEVLVNKFSHVRFEPSGFTKNPDIPIAKSLIDYIYRFLGTRFLSSEQRSSMGLGGAEDEDRSTAATGGSGNVVNIGDGRPSAVAALGFSPQADAPSCPDCGAIMVRNGSCYKCLNCGATSGCS
jgi:ribonucleoside-diphosphate reductase alpha chain